MKKSLFITSAVMTAVLAVGLSTSTYAWYSTTIGGAVKATTTVSAKVNDIDATYNLKVPTLQKVAQTIDATTGKATQSSSWESITADTEATADELNDAFTLTDGILGSAFGKAEVNDDAEDSHWYTAYSSENKSHLDTASAGILALRYTYVIPGVSSTDTLVHKDYKVQTVFTIKCNETGKSAPFAYAYLTEDTLNPGTATAYSAAVTNTYEIPQADEGKDASTADLTKYVVFYIDGAKIGKESGMTDIDSLSFTITFEMSVVSA